MSTTKLVTPNPDGTTTDLEDIARKRAIQTFLQGLGIDVLVAVSLVVLTQIDKITDETGWILMGTTILKSIITATFAYFLRKFQDKSGFAPREAIEPVPRRAA